MTTDVDYIPQLGRYTPKERRRIWAACRQKAGLPISKSPLAILGVVAVFFKDYLVGLFQGYSHTTLILGAVALAVGVFMVFGIIERLYEPRILDYLRKLTPEQLDELAGRTPTSELQGDEDADSDESRENEHPKGDDHAKRWSAFFSR
jgi:hypothetical protein